MSASARPLKYLLGWLIAGTRGGATRAKIIETLKETPQNANQLATLLGMDYRTIRHHIKVLGKKQDNHVSRLRLRHHVLSVSSDGGELRFV
jgi:DNA-binding transcriptional ArsR family regulator